MASTQASSSATSCSALQSIAVGFLRPPYLVERGRPLVPFRCPTGPLAHYGSPPASTRLGSPRRIVCEAEVPGVYQRFASGDRQFAA